MVDLKFENQNIPSKQNKNHRSSDSMTFIITLGACSDSAMRNTLLVIDRTPRTLKSMSGERFKSRCSLRYFATSSRYSGCEFQRSRLINVSVIRNVKKSGVRMNRQRKKIDFEKKKKQVEITHVLRRFSGSECFRLSPVSNDPNSYFVQIDVFNRIKRF